MSFSGDVQGYSEHIQKSKQPFIADLLLTDLVKFYVEIKTPSQATNFSIRSTELDTSELVELLQQSAVEHLTAYRQL